MKQHFGSQRRAGGHKPPVRDFCYGARIFVLGSLSPPMNLPRQTLVYHLLHIGKFMRGRVGVGGRVQLDSPPLPNPLRPYTCRRNQHTSYVSRGKCTGERGPNSATSKLTPAAKFCRPCAAGYLVILCLLTACHRDMRDQPRYEALEASTFFSDGQSARPRVEGTIARGQLNDDESFHTGRAGTQFVSEIPLKLDRPLMQRGQERFNIYCAVCHARTGNGDGMIVQRGFRRPPSFHIERLRNAPAGHFFDVMTNGFGAMPSYRVQVPAADRWAIVAYIRVLQMSQQAKLEDVPADERTKLMESQP
jgi:hypothetical protein